VRDPSLAVGMALDGREPIARRGARLLRTPSLWVDDLEFVSAQLPAELLDLTGLLNRGSEVKGADAAVSVLEAEKRQVTKKKERLQRQVRQLKELLQEREQELERVKGLWKEGKKEIERLKARIDELNASIDGKVEAKVEEILSSLIGQRTAICLREAVAGDDPVQNLLTQADRALEAQRAIDARCGARSILREWIGRLEEKLKEVRAAISDSLFPSKGLVRAAASLEREIGRLRALLEERPGTSLLSLGSGDKGAILEEAPDGPYRLPSEERMALAPPSPTMKVLKRGKERGENHLPTSFPREIANLSAFVLEHRALCSRALLLVDGYNVIKGAAAWRNMKSHDLAAVRDRFSRLLRAKAREWGEGELVFDGQGGLASAELLGNFSVVFTSDIGDGQRADTYIIERLALVKGRDPHLPTFLMTADQGLREAVAQHCDYFIDPRWGAITYLAPGE